MTTAKLRKVAASDANIIAKHRYFDARATSQDQQHYATWVAEAIRTGIYIGMLAEIDGQVIAGVGVVLLQWGPTRGNASPVRGRIVNLYTEPPLRRRGIARQVVSATLACAEAIGITSFNLGTTEEAQSLYESLGFVSYPAEMLMQRQRSAN
jgi:GNAT superfamily N-acetyltransferase